MYFQTPLARRKKFVAIRQEHRAGDNDTDGDGASVRYLSSQYLADSSLGGDISQYDFTASVQASVSYCEGDTLDGGGVGWGGGGGNFSINIQ